MAGRIPESGEALIPMEDRKNAAMAAARPVTDDDASTYFKTNNFDLIRLLAAAQVMIFHSMAHLEVPWPGMTLFVGYFPGVPAFFFVSGFLISASWERNSNLRVFFTNRALRIFPALWAVLVFSLITLFVFYDGGILYDNLLKLGLWAFCQATILQDWNPGFLSGYGTGGVNGSLWTIPVELSFYFFVPIIYFAFRRLGKPDAILAAVILLSFTLQYATYSFVPADATDLFLQKLVKKSPLPWVGMFCFGIFAQRHIVQIHKIVAGRALQFFCLYLAISLLTALYPAYPLLQGNSNSMGIVNYTAMVAMLLAVAFTRPQLADHLLNRNDISYGVYIFHMPVINVFVQTGHAGPVPALLAIAVSTGVAFLSWRLIEKPALKMRSWALYKRG